MRGTIYLSKTKKTSDEDKETALPNIVEEDRQEKDQSDSGVYEAEQLSEEEESQVVWKPGFLQPEEELEEEAEKLSEYQHFSKPPMVIKEPEELSVEEKLSLEKVENMPSNLSEPFKKYLIDFKHSVKRSLTCLS